ncbi:hypothetical protein ACLVWU_10835 [Bdellovibrio sp. HCB290]|uniref:hypothetical protein n=1 Tax=Bdellovibrio sp. HCB290 TaxID=3394356 RepID=UPI0039B61867
MKKFVMFAIVLATAVTSNAAPLAPTNSQIYPERVDQAIRLTQSRTEGVLRKVTIVTTDNGMSTDVSPRHSIYLTYNSFAEMGNLSAAYLITDEALSDVQAKRIEAGIYEVSYMAYREEKGMVMVTKTINAIEAFIADKDQREACGIDFCDGDIKASIDVKETSKKVNF